MLHFARILPCPVTMINESLCKWLNLFNNCLIVQFAWSQRFCSCYYWIDLCMAGKIRKLIKTLTIWKRVHTSPQHYKSCKIKKRFGSLLVTVNSGLERPIKKLWESCLIAHSVADWHLKPHFEIKTNPKPNWNLKILYSYDRTHA